MILRWIPDLLSTCGISSSETNLGAEPWANTKEE